MKILASYIVTTLCVDENMARQMHINTLEKLLEHGAGVAFRKEYLDALGLYNEEYRNCEDYDLILRYVKNFDGYHLRLPYYRYFKRKGSLSTNVEDRKKIKIMLNEVKNV